MNEEPFVPDEAEDDAAGGGRAKPLRVPLPRTQEEARERAAWQRYWGMLTMLWHLYVQRGVSDPSMYPIPPETLKADYLGPEEDGFPEFADVSADLLLAEIGRLVAAMGGHLEVQAVFRETTITLLVEPGPEHLDDGGY